MIIDDGSSAAALAELRWSFDRSFAEPPPAPSAARYDLLGITIGVDPYAVPLAEVSGIFANRKFTPLPSAIAELLGLVGLRGAILPAYDLRALLGYPRGGPCRWLLLTRGLEVALAFDRVDGYLRVPRESVMVQQALSSRSRHIREVVRTEPVARPVIHIASVLEQIGHSVHQRAHKEQ